MRLVHEVTKQQTHRSTPKGLLPAAEIESLKPGTRSFAKPPLPSEFALMWDFFSVCQRDDQQRIAPAEEEAKKSAIRSMELWYAHTLTTVFLLNYRNERLGPDRQYDARGYDCHAGVSRSHTSHTTSLAHASLLSRLCCR